ncbi:MAG: hypothetical protein PWR10_1456 [Halanaerobiales bacterium]|nr:hypothetical protein [Halanaerobiales bacterium]
MNNRNTYEQLMFQMKVSELYFLEGYDQQKIGKVLGCSTSTVSRALKSARQNGIVEVRIKNPLKEARDIANKLKEKYSLKKVIVVRGIYSEPQTFRKAIGIAAAELAGNILEDGHIVGISSGRTIYEMIKSLHLFSKDLDIEVIPLLGGMGIVETKFQINELSRMFANNFSGKSKVLNVPIVVKEKKTHDLLMEEKGTKEITNIWKKLDIVFVAIGPPASVLPPLISNYSNLSKDEENLIQSNAVGDICGRFFDKDGNECKTNVSQRIISIDFKLLKKVPCRVGIAGGKEKVDGIRGALSKGLINILVTDEETAKSVLRRTK